MERDSRLQNEPTERGKTITLPGLIFSSGEVVKDLLISGKPIKPSMLTLVGLRTAFRDTSSPSLLNENQDIERYINMARFEARTNDLIDMLPLLLSEEKQNSFDAGIIKEHFSSARDERQMRLSRLRDKTEGRSIYTNAINNYMGEIALLNREERNKASNERSLQDVLYYRELENAISLVNLSAIVMEPQVITERMIKPIETRSRKAIEHKYRWIIAGEPADKAEKNLCALFNLVMGLQVTDDLNDYPEDEVLGLHTLATEGLRAADGDVDRMKEMLLPLADHYYAEAIEFGATRAAGWGTNTTFKIAIKLLMRTFPERFGGPREQLLEDLRKNGFNN